MNDERWPSDAKEAPFHSAQRARFAARNGARAISSKFSPFARGAALADACIMHIRALPVVLLPLLATFASASSADTTHAEDTSTSSEALFDLNGGGGIIVINRPRPTVTLAAVTRLQPGCGRARVTWDLDASSPSVVMTATCTAPGLESSLAIKPLSVSRSTRTAIVDIKRTRRSSWITPARCRAT